MDARLRARHGELMSKQPHKVRRYKAEIKPTAFDLNGRPCRTRNLVISCIVSADERAAIIEAAQAAQLSVSAYLREMAFGLGYDQPASESETDPDRVATAHSGDAIVDP